MYLLDTNVLSDAQKGVPAPIEWLRSANPPDLFLSALSIGEIRRGIEKIRTSNPRKHASLSAWLETLRRNNAEQILPIDERVALTWGQISVGRKGAEVDELIAATALVHGLKLVTRNVRDFDSLGLEIINPWAT